MSSDTHDPLHDALRDNHRMNHEGDENRADL
jgi:hypothetical protein